MKNHNIILKMNTSKETIQTITIHTADGEAVRVDALNHVYYELMNQETGFAPNQVITRRDGHDLWVYFDRDDFSQPDLMIMDYYRFDDTNVLMGRDVDGQYYRYLPESGYLSHAVGQLADHAVAEQVLGGDALASSSWTFDGSWLLSLLPVATVLIASVGHHGGHDSAHLVRESADESHDVVATHSPENTSENAAIPTQNQQADELKSESSEEQVQQSDAYHGHDDAMVDHSALRGVRYLNGLLEDRVDVSHRDVDSGSVAMAETVSRHLSWLDEQANAPLIA